MGGLVTTSIMGRPRTATTAMPRRQTHKPWVRMPRGVSKPRRSEDTLLGRMTASLGATKGQARRASRAAGLQRNGASRAAGLQRKGCRHSGNPHAVGYSCDFVTAPVPTELKFAKLTNGRPSIMRAIWRGMYRVRGREGDAVGESLGSRKLRTTLYRYTQQGGRSIYNLVNRMLARKKGKDLNDGPVRNWLIDLVMIVRLLWSVDGPDKLYRGVPRGRANAQIYRTARSSHMTVEWHALTSTSLDRHIALPPCDISLPLLSGSRIARARLSAARQLRLPPPTSSLPVQTCGFCVCRAVFGQPRSPPCPPPPHGEFQTPPTSTCQLPLLAVT